MNISQLLFLLVLTSLLIAVFKRSDKAHYLFLTAALFCFQFGLVDQSTALSVLSNPGVVTLVILLVASLVLEKTELMSVFSRRLFQAKPAHLKAGLFSGVAISSSFLSNTAVVATLINPLTKSKKIAPSKLLLPLSYFSIAGGCLTLVGTSTNLIVNAQVVEYGYEGLGFFDFTLSGIAGLLGVAVAMVLCQRWLPTRWSQQEDIAEHTVEARLPDGSSLNGLSVEAAGLRHLEHFFLVEIVRRGALISPIRPSHVLRAGDKLLFSGDVSKINSLAIIDGLELYAHVEGFPMENLEEVMVKPGSILVGKSLKTTQFRSRFDAAVVAIRRQGQSISGKLGDVPLEVGDILTIACGTDFASRPNIQRNFYTLTTVITHQVVSGVKQWLALGGFLASITVSALFDVSLVRTLLPYLALMMFLGVLSTNDLKHRFPFRIVSIVLGALVIAAAFKTTGLSDLFVSWVNLHIYGVSPFVAVVAVYLMANVFTELVTNNAAAAMLVPIALSVASALGADPAPYVLAAAFGASASFINPFGYQTNLMVMNAGGYRFIDFVRCGSITSICFGSAVLTSLYFL